MITTPAQSRRALLSANDVRTGRRELRECVQGLDRRSGALMVAGLLLDPPRSLRSAYVWQVVDWVRQVGERTGPRLLRAADIDPWRKVGRTTERQRRLLAGVLREFAEGPVRAAPRRDGRSCAGCGVRLRTPATLCGFCEMEREEAA